VRSLRAQLRTSTAPLAALVHRHWHGEEEERPSQICSFCNLNQPEDQEHILLTCPTYDCYRQSLLQLIQAEWQRADQRGTIYGRRDHHANSPAPPPPPVWWTEARKHFFSIAEHNYSADIGSWSTMSTLQQAQWILTFDCESHTATSRAAVALADAAGTVSVYNEDLQRIWNIARRTNDLILNIFSHRHRSLSADE
jgi:hypothetical protein